MVNSTLEFLKQPLRVGHVELRNRLVMPPMATRLSEDGTVSQASLDHYAERSRGGHIGLVITEHCYITPEGKASQGQMSVSRDSDVRGLSKLADTIHANGSVVLAQINHSGFRADPKLTGRAAVCASKSGYERLTGESGASLQELTCDSIHKLVWDFAAAARRVKEAGFDGVEIHSAHGYLLNQFYSPLSNMRIDEYGCTLSGRLRLHLEVVKAAREAVGEDFIVALRLGACDYLDGGSTPEDCGEAAVILEKAGIDLLDISGGFCRYSRPGHSEPGYFAELSEAAKSRVSIPVMLTGGIKNGEDAESLLVGKKADLIGIGRAILADPSLPGKIIA